MSKFVQRFIKTFRKRTDRRRYKHYARVFAFFEQAESKSLIYIDIKNKRLLLSDVLTAPFAIDQNKWLHFFNGLGYWFKFRMAEDYWTKVRIDEETKAIREAKAEHGHLTEEELAIIRARVMSSTSDQEAFDFSTCNGYEFYVCEGLLRSDAKAEAVGFWQDGQVNLRMID